MEYSTVKVSRENGIGRITLNKPPVNVLDIPMMEEMNAALDELKDDDTIKCLVIDADGKAFSAGVDVSDHTADKVDRMIEVFHGIFRRLAEVPVPTVALVDGAALGGGYEVAQFCDILLSSERSKFGQPEIQVGVFPPIAAIMLPYLHGWRTGFELVITGDIVRAGRALELGLVNHVYPVESFEEECDKFLGKLTALSAPVLRSTKKAMLAGSRGTFTERLGKVEKVYLAELMGLHDAHEGLAAFLEKRRPVWKNE